MPSREEKVAFWKGKRLENEACVKCCIEEVLIRTANAHELDKRNRPYWSVGEIASLVRGIHCNNFDLLPKEEQYTLCQKILSRLVKKGKVTRILGDNLRGNLVQTYNWKGK